VGAVGGGRSSWPSVSRFRFVPRDEDSFNPSEVAFINIWCLVRELPHFSHRASHIISPLALRCSSASFFSLSVSSSDQAPWFPPLPAAPPVLPLAEPVAGVGLGPGGGTGG